MLKFQRLEIKDDTGDEPRRRDLLSCLAVSEKLLVLIPFIHVSLEAHWMLMHIAVRPLERTEALFAFSIHLDPPSKPYPTFIRLQSLMSL